MKPSVNATKLEATERAALRRRVSQFYLRFNKADWEGCRKLIDPQLIRQGKVNFATYSRLMQAFKNAHGGMKPWATRLSLHLKPTPHQDDKRPFAYVYVVWQDEAHGFHMFRHRWVKDRGQWFTRVVGLVPNRTETAGRDQ